MLLRRLVDTWVGMSLKKKDRRHSKSSISRVLTLMISIIPILCNVIIPSTSTYIVNYICCRICSMYAIQQPRKINVIYFMFIVIKSYNIWQTGM